jgi:hypothetical protein
MKKADFKRPVVREREPVTLPDGFEAFVRGTLGFGELVALERFRAKARESSAEDFLTLFAPQLLSVTIVDEDGELLMTPQEWADYANAGPDYKAAVFSLFNKAYVVAGFDVEAAKKN